VQRASAPPGQPPRLAADAGSASHLGRRRQGDHSLRRLGHHNVGCAVP
jgi:hypothetical protein